MPVDWLIFLLPIVALGSIVAVVYGLFRRRRGVLIAAGATLTACVIVFLLVYQAPGWKLKTAAERGDVDAQYMLGRWYIHRYGYAWPDRQLSALWIQKAASQGHPEAMCNLGLLYAYGCPEAGIRRDKEKARRMYEASAALGVSEATEMLEAMEED